MLSNLNERLEHIPRKLIELAIKDEKREIFGAWNHQYILNPCLSKKEVAQFEAEHNIQLPTDYRAFLLQVGNGGAGPNYGMYRLDKCLDQLGVVRANAHPERPFPHTKRWSAWYQLQCEQERHDYGLIVLSDEGCGMTSVLIVSGAEKGHVWKDDRANNGEIFPLCLDTKPNAESFYGTSKKDRLSFLDWYEHWLNKSLAFS